MDEEFYLKLSNGYRMEKPKYCPGFIFKEIMSRCWVKDPSERPEFGQLSTKLGDLLEASVRQHYVDLNDPYTEMNQVLFSNHDYLNMKSTEEQEDYVDMNTASDQGRRSSTPIECDLIQSVSASGVGGISGVGGVNEGPMIQLDSYPDLRRCGEDNKHWGPY